MTVKQQKYAWFLMSEIDKYDPPLNDAALRYRLSGLITKQFRMTSFPEDPFRFLTRAQGAALMRRNWNTCAVKKAGRPRGRPKNEE